MMRLHKAVAVAVCLTASVAGAQERTPTATLVPAVVSRWDAAAHVMWLGEHWQASRSLQWDRWIGVAAGGGSLGYYWTPHLKTEFDVSTSHEGEAYSVEPVAVPGLTNPLFVQRHHEIGVTTASAGVIGQFYENAWFHPFVGAGVELVREREHIETEPPPVPPRAPTVSLTQQAETHVRYSGRPYVTTGFKAYLSDHAFVRTELRTSWSGDGLSALGWRTGVGVDF
jgi:hypothetical protein